MFPYHRYLEKANPMKSVLHGLKKEVVALLAAVLVLLVTGISFAVPHVVQDRFGNHNGDGVLLVNHKGIPHGLMHSMGRRGSGFCPQLPSMARAPDRFYNKKNPGRYIKAYFKNK